ncbi:MAG: hypothetical protein Q8M24_07540 [Pseudolabrys sp.]|nr:hypothetical protein [Pseudolabrys sp.]MDP2295303.1 hypothetical protein [Pseudolabrys sp.]
MSEGRAAILKAKRESLARLKEAALVALERRGYEVRGKTTTQIREVLRHSPTKPRPEA